MQNNMLYTCMYTIRYYVYMHKTKYYVLSMKSNTVFKYILRMTSNIYGTCMRVKTSRKASSLNASMGWLRLVGSLN